MNTARTFLLVMLLAAILGCTINVAGAQTQTPGLVPRGPGAAVAAFYKTHLPRAHSGLMDADELAQLRPFLSNRLHSLYSAAVQYQADLISRHPNAKPPCVEGGDDFDSLSEWPDGVQSNTDDPTKFFEVLLTERHENSAWRVAVRFWYDTTPVVTWVDRVVVVEQDDRYVIDDVIYSGDTYNKVGLLSNDLKDCATRYD